MKTTLLSVMVVTACSAPEDGVGVAVNQLGISALDISRGEHVFDLRGLAADGAERARFHLRVDDSGTNIDISALDEKVHVFTPETQLAHQTPTGYPQADAFLRLPEVASSLEREAGIHVITPDEVGAVETSYSTATCPAYYLLTTPLARQCCWDGLGTSFINDSNTVIRRIYNYAHGGQGCRASDGVSPCSGTSCYYGPLGFAVWTTASASPPYIYPKVQPQFSLCAWAFYPTPQTPIFPNVTGTQPRGLVCPGGSGGTSTAKWDYPIQ